MFKFVAHVYCHTSDIQLALLLVTVAGLRLPHLNARGSGRLSNSTLSLLLIRLTPRVDLLAICPKAYGTSLDEVTNRISATRSNRSAGVHRCIFPQPSPCPTQKRLPWKPRSHLIPMLTQAMQGTQPSGGSFGLRSHHAIDQLHHGLVVNFEVIDLEFHASDATFNCPNKPNITPQHQNPSLGIGPGSKRCLSLLPSPVV